jgi:thioredoxin-related protein
MKMKPSHFTTFSFSMLITLLIIPFSAFQPTENQQPSSGGIQWMTFDEMQAAQLKEPRKVLVDLYTDWCGWCKKMDASTFGDQAIINYINKNFYAVKLNGEKDVTVNIKGREYKLAKINNRDTHELAWELGSANNRLGYPTVVILDEQISKLNNFPGYKDVEAMEILLRYYGENIYKTKSWQDYISGGK